MTVARALLTLLLVITAAPATAQDRRPGGRPGAARIMVRERIVIRIPRVLPRADVIARRNPIAPPRGIRWKEKGSAQCVALADLSGEAATDRGDIDLMLADGGRVRAKLADDCPALDFYTGFYLKPTADGAICGKRDVIRARSGASCPIEKFRRLVER